MITLENEDDNDAAFLIDVKKSLSLTSYFTASIPDVSNTTLTTLLNIRNYP